jgi:AsmA family protein
MANRLTARLRKWLRWTLWSVGGILAAVVLLFLYVTFVGVTVDASFLRGRLAETFTDNIGRQVRFEGPVQLEVSAHPKLRVGGLHIANAPGFEGADFASLGEARLALDLWPLLFRKRLQIEELSGSDVRARLQRGADGSNNWTFGSSRSRSPAPPQPGATPAITAGEAVTLLDIQRISLEGLNVEYIAADGGQHFFELRALRAQSPSGQPFTMTLDGTVEKTFPYKLDFTGGPLADVTPGRPWPVDMQLTFLSSTLTINGNVSGDSGEVSFGLGTESLTEFERLFQSELPDVGPSGIAGKVRYTPRSVAVEQLSGVMGRTTLIGQLGFDYTGERPKITGELHLPSLDLRPFLGERPRDESATPRSLGDLYRDLSGATFSLRQFSRADIDVTLGIQRWLSLPGEVRDAFVRINLQNGKLDAPVGATISGVVLSGSASADSTATPPNFRLALGTRDSDLGGLARLLLGVDGLRGRLGRFDLQLSAKGDQVKELVRSLDVKLDIERGRLSYGNLEGGRPVEFGLDDFSIALPPGEPLSGSMQGTLLGNRFSGRMRAGALEPMMLESRSPLNVELRSGSVRARVHGVLQPPAAERGPEIEFRVTAPRAGEMASWFGFKPGADAAAALSGKASMRTSEWRLDDGVFRLGRTTLLASVARVGIGSQPLVKLKLAADQIDLKELESLMPEPKPKPAQSAPDRPVVDIPILPQGIDLTDADIEVRVKRFAGSPLEVRDVSFDGRIREGYMHPSPFSASVAETVFTGAVLMDLRGTEPSAGLWLFAGNVDAGSLLRKFGITAGIDATFSEFGINLVARASRLGEMLARSELLGQLGGGRIVLRDANTKAEARIAVDKGELRADPGAPLKLSLRGALDDVPVSVSLETARANDLIDPKARLPFRLEAEAAGTRARFDGTIARPIGSEVELAMQLQGSRFDSLNKLVRASLPPWGPWSASGRFRMSPRGYEVPDLKLQVGDSTLQGDGRLDTALGRPRLDVTLTAQKIQLDDFRLGEWTPVEKKPETQTKPPGADEMRTRAAEGANRAQKLLSREVFSRQDAVLSVKVDQVLSGADQLGSGHLEARLENGRADIGPIVVNVPGGSAKLQLGYEPTEGDVRVDLQMDIEKFDYGVLARRIKPESDLQGTFSVKMAVDSRSQYLSDILSHGSGKIEFAVWPQNMESGIFDLWAVNVLVALVPAVDPGNASRINCAIGRFDLNDGKLVDRTILMDTSRMRVTGKGKADFGSEELELRMRPQAKKAQFLSLATPIRVSGTFTDFKVGVSPGDVIETVGRLATSIVWVPLQKLAGKKIPADGADVCVGRFEDSQP